MGGHLTDTIAIY